jgi:hypothetical protein
MFVWACEGAISLVLQSAFSCGLLAEDITYIKAQIKKLFVELPVNELSMLSLHLLQNCMVYVSTLMLQQVLARPHWANRLTARDRHALTPLFREHVNPYGHQELDMLTRIAALA